MTGVEAGGSRWKPAEADGAEAPRSAEAETRKPRRGSRGTEAKKEERRLRGGTLLITTRYQVEINPFSGAERPPERSRRKPAEANGAEARKRGSRGAEAEVRKPSSAEARKEEQRQIYDSNQIS